jgi:hypothetical protein
VKKQSGSELACFLHERLPKHCPENEYVINFHNLNKEVKNVSHKMMGNIKFEAIKIDEASGYVHGSTVKIWT